MPEMPAAKRERYLTLGLPLGDVLTLADEVSWGMSGWLE